MSTTEETRAREERHPDRKVAVRDAARCAICMGCGLDTRQHPDEQADTRCRYCGGTGRSRIRPASYAARAVALAIERTTEEEELEPVALEDLTPEELDTVRRLMGDDE